MPKISVITATYNRADVLGRAMESLEDQTFENYEHLVVDDGSTDDTATVVGEHADDRVRYIELDRNRGQAAAYNRGVRAARGEYVSFLDSDDEYLHRRLEATSEVLDDEPERIAGVAHSYERVDDEVSVQSVPDGEITFDRLAANNVICGISNTMYRASVFDRTGGFDESLPAEVDYDFQLRVLDEFRLRGVDETLVRKHDRSDGVQNDSERKRQGVKQFLAKHGSVLPDIRVAQKYRSVGRGYLETDDRANAARYFERSLWVCPDSFVAELQYDIGRDYLKAGYGTAGRSYLLRSAWSRPGQHEAPALFLFSLVPGDVERSVERARAVRDALGG